MNIVNIRIELSNPFDRREFFKNLGCLSGKITKHLAWELEHSYLSTMLLDTDIRWTRNIDHAGIDITIGILGYGIGFRIYDTRHWNYETDSWEIYNV
jgi:hypothetical protein